MQRREFITLLAGAALIGPPTAIAQTPKVYRLGTLTAGPPMSPGSGDAAVLIGALTQLHARSKPDIRSPWCGVRP